MMKVLSKRVDGSFVIDGPSGPYHTEPGDKYFDEAKRLAKNLDLPTDPVPPPPPSQKEIDALEAGRLLNETDWMVVRMLETGKPVPKDVTDARASARTKIEKDSK